MRDTWIAERPQIGQSCRAGMRVRIVQAALDGPWSKVKAVINLASEDCAFVILWETRLRGVGEMSRHHVYIFVPRAKNKPVILAFTKELWAGACMMNGATLSVARDDFRSSWLKYVESASLNPLVCNPEMSDAEIADKFADLKSHGRFHALILKTDNIEVISNRKIFNFKIPGENKLLLEHIDY